MQKFYYNMILCKHMVNGVVSYITFFAQKGSDIPEIKFVTLITIFLNNKSIKLCQNYGAY